MVTTVLSQSGQEVLLKVVDLPFMNFAACLFSIPQAINNKVKSTATHFFWRGKARHNKIHWLSWNCISQSKDKGSIGLRDPTLHNKALLSKVAWRLFVVPDVPDSVWDVLMKSIYFSKVDFLEAKVGSNPSWAWRSIIQGREVLKASLIWRISDGSKMNIWKDNYVPTLLGFKIGM
ncbi:uncharacterized mitochondrial protein AtMg00310-like [Telopea speciosissima]|uniref:uncharacterized mitochondrial protein AtMg00310-like n=1 Tax=Telopea speciosissima TaxID=54955 RepID=UPI001CC744C7|nr:uncharacterized mitochondrial protein AtMg00310-like [Telopea speciosissima]